MKIEDTELEQLRELQKKSQEIVVKLGEISYNEIRIKQNKKQIESELKVIQEEENTLKEYLINKYGPKLNINLETGEY